MSYLDFLLAFGKLVTTRVNGALKVIVGDLSFFDGDEDERPETSSDEPLWVGAPGFYCRPRSATTEAAATPLQPEGHTEVVALRVGGMCVPIAARDLRCNSQVNPREAELGLAHWDGGFVSLQSNTDEDGTNIVLYAPRKNASGVVVKASAISMDSTDGNQHIALMHESGASITLTKDGAIVLANAAGDAFIELNSSGTTFNGNAVLSGAAVLGNKDPATCDFVMLATQLLAWVAQVNAAMVALNGATGGNVPAIVVPTAVPVAAAMVKGI